MMPEQEPITNWTERSQTAPEGEMTYELLGELLASLVSTAGTYLLTIGGILVTLLIVTDISLSGGLEVMNDFTVNVQGVGQTTTVGTG